jgi:hypothetical protein
MILSKKCALRSGKLLEQFLHRDVWIDCRNHHLMLVPPQQVATGSGERRLPACCRRQPADDIFAKRISNQTKAFRQAAEKNRLVACAPQIRALSDLRVTRLRV